MALPSIGPLEGAFLENAGQLPDARIRYYAVAGGVAIGLATGTVDLVLGAFPPSPRSSGSDHNQAVNAHSQAAAIRIVFEGANPVEPRGLRPLTFPSNFFLGNDSANWRTGVRSYEEVVYPSLWPGIDLSYRLAEKGPKYTFLIREGAHPDDIRMTYEGVEDLVLDPSGDLIVSTALGDVRDSAPDALLGGRPTQCGLALQAPRTVGFRCLATNLRGDLVIDPLVYATFLGGNRSDQGWAIAVDGAGNAFLTGDTQSLDFPATPGAFDVSPDGGRDAFVAALSPDGRTLLFATYLGGTQTDVGTSIAIDTGGDLHLAGQTTSPNFPTTPGALDRTCGTDGTCDYDGTTYRWDAFVAELNPTGSTLLYSTFLGGSGDDDAASIALVAGGDAFVGGETSSVDFPATPGAFDTSLRGDYDVFVARLNRTGSGLVYATLLGGTWEEYGGFLTVDPGGNVYVTGGTNSTDFPTTPGAYDTSYNSQAMRNEDAFVAKLNPNGSGLVYATYLGGFDEDMGTAIAIDGAGDAIIAGNTRSSDFPTTPRAFQGALRSIGRDDGFVAKLDPAGGSLVFSTYLGGTGAEAMSSLALDPRGNVHLAGGTPSADFPTTQGALDRSLSGQSDAFYAELDANGTTLLYGTFLGGNNPGVEYAAAVALGPGGTVYLGGSTTSSDFPVTPGAFDTTYGGGAWGDAFVARLGLLPDLVITPADISVSPTSPPTGIPAKVFVNITDSGESGAGAFDTVAFEDRNANGLIDPGEAFGTVTTVALSTGNSSTLVFSWTPDSVGLHWVCAWADPLDLVLEENENNNKACIGVTAVLGPPLKPDYVPWQPQPGGSIVSGLMLPVSLSLAVHNAGNGSAASASVLAFRNESLPPFAAFPVPPLAAGATSVRFTASWTSPATPGTYRVAADADDSNDIMEWNETNNEHVWTITVVPGPATSLVVGTPNVTTAATYVTSHTPLSFSVRDQGGTGIRNTTYRVDGGPWRNFTATGPFTLAGDGEHLLEWRSADRAGNVETVRNATLILDDTPPATTADVGTPNHVSDRTYVTSATPIALTSADGGAIPVGLASVEYRIDGGSWTTYAAAFTLSGADGPRTIEYRGVDRLGNAEATRTLVLVLDDSPPTTDIAPGTGPFTTETRFNLTAADAGCGVARTEYRIDGGSWIPYSTAFTVQEGDHVIGYRSVDRLNNTEAEHTLSVTITGTTEFPVEFDWKPFVALVFSLILTLAGVWSSKRAPWKGGNGRRAMLTAFALTALPFIVLEVATGIVSLLTALLSIPPVLGVGTTVDAGILVAGLTVAGYRAMGARRPRPATSEP